MKVAVLSDLHLYHWANTSGGKGVRKLMGGIKASLEEERPDIIIDAGDLERPDIWYDYVESNLVLRQTPYITVSGNHDYYGKYYQGPYHDMKYMRVGGVLIIAATLWTDFNKDDPLAHDYVGRGLNDFHLIKNFNTRICYETHKLHRQFIEDNSTLKPDIIVTHHSPSYRSVHPQFVGSPLNAGFASDMDEVVEKSGAKLWVHGHMHDPSDYYIGETRVIANPCGYPMERTKKYLPQYFVIGE